MVCNTRSDHLHLMTTCWLRLICQSPKGDLGRQHRLQRIPEIREVYLYHRYVISVEWIPLYIAVFIQWVWFLPGNHICGIKARTNGHEIKLQYLISSVWHMDYRRLKIKWNPCAKTSSWNIAISSLRHHFLPRYVQPLNDIHSCFRPDTTTWIHIAFI